MQGTAKQCNVSVSGLGVTDAKADHVTMGRIATQKRTSVTGRTGLARMGGESQFAAAFSHKRRHSETVELEQETHERSFFQ